MVPWQDINSLLLSLIFYLGYIISLEQIQQQRQMIFVLSMQIRGETCLETAESAAAESLLNVVWRKYSGLVIFGYDATTAGTDWILLNLNSRNAMCGKVQCTNVDLSTIPSGAQVSIQIVQGSTCVNADFNLGSDVLDPAYVNPGSPCDKGKVNRLKEWKLF